MALSQKADVIEDEIARQVAKTRRHPWLCSIAPEGEGPGPFLQGTDTLLPKMPEKPTPTLQ